MILFLFIIPIMLILIKLALYFIVLKYGKISYDGFFASGFAYDTKKDIFYSTRNAWQRNFGYTYMYDVLAPLFRMIIDTQPIRFNYNNKNWLITFWKGQYGIVTGAEVGIYCTKQKKINKKTVYLPIDDSEMLDMSLILYKNNKIITKVKAKHWWLAIFKLGMFSKSKELSMDINITFPNYEMLEAFLNSFKKLRYKSKYYNVINNTFCFKYLKPHTKKVWTRSWLTDSIRQYFNRKNVELYNNYLDDLIDNSEIDDTKINKKLIIVNNLIPDFLKNNSKNRNKSKQVINKMFSANKKNIVFLNSDVYSKYRVDNHE